MSDLDAVWRHRDDPAALEVQAIKEWAEELASIAEEWLTGRERLRAQQAEQREAAEHRAQTQLPRSTP